MRKIYFGLSGNASEGDMLIQSRKQTRLLEFTDDPVTCPDWMPDKDLKVFSEAFEAGGFRGPLNRYRAQALDPEQMTSVHGQRLAQPTCFIAGELDPVRRFVPGVDTYAYADSSLDDFRGKTLIAGAGHWVQQEAPAETNQALANFLTSLNASGA